MEQQQIRDYLELHKAELLEQLCRFIQIPSVSSHQEGVQRALRFALDLAQRLGFRTEYLLDGQVGIVEIGEGEEVLGILAHVDVVEPGDRGEWETPPFEGNLIDGAVYGRGALDNKGPVIAVLYAMKAALDSGHTFHKKVRLILGTQEEVDWSDMRAYTASYGLPDYGFSPDGEFPVCNIEKGVIDAEMIFPLPPDDYEQEVCYLTTIDAGSVPSIIPGACTACLIENNGTTLVTTTLRTSGRAIHSCLPSQGDNALLTMIDELEKLPLAENQLLRVLRMIREKFTDLYGESLGLYSESEYFEGEFVHRNVFIPTVISVSGGEAHLHIDVRFGYGTDPHSIIRVLEQTAKDYGGRLAASPYLPAVYISSKRPFLQAFAQAYEEMTGLKNEFTLAYGGSYAKAMPNIISWGPIFPGEEDTCHAENEYITVDSLMANAAVFAAAISRIAFSEESFK